nr:uncharacterized protein LOC111515238 [Leptinotarsa decemlineata]
MIIDSGRLYGPHVIAAAKKAEARAACLARLMPNIRGPDSSKRAILGGVVQSILLYGAPIWYPAMRMEKYRQILIKTQRKSLVRIISAYRTVSAEAAQVVAGMNPIDLLAAERKYTHERSGGTKEKG